ncbi:MAG TPA: sulfotransferase [Verrucomicrobiae bacterium]|nr:sulfotransferase [Verrucomicrobiae bacterium]
MSVSGSTASTQVEGGRRPILVTGSPRSGTTWVGRVIAASPLVGYIPEPFNLHCRPGRCAAHFPYWFFYICDENQEEYTQHIRRTIGFQYQVREELKATRTPYDVARMARDFSRFCVYRFQQRRALFRDPHAVLSAEWLARRFSADVVVLIRQPAAFVSSFKALGWEHPFDHFLKQPLLMRDYLHPFENEIRQFAEHRQDPVDQAILLWRLIHGVILRYRETHPEWTFARHRDLSLNPIGEFHRIFERVGLPYGTREEINTRHYCMAEANPGGYVWNDVVRNSAQNMNLWRARLTEEELARVREKCSDLAREFFTEDEMRDAGLIANA